jgi:beta-glucosidase
MMVQTKMVPGEWGALASNQPRSREEIADEALRLLQQMSLEEKIQQMSGDTPYLLGLFEMMRAYNTRPLPAGENLRLGIPGIRFSDGPRGVVMYNSTCFPASMARGASWDPDLEARIGDCIGVEARAQGANFFGGVCINLLRHPAWGRAQETYGEDSYHLGEMGAALVRGVQRHMMACVKHYACNSMENARFKVNVKISERTLHEIYLPHFKRCIDEGAASVMSAYNKVNGEHCGHNRRLLTEILKEQWGFDGFVVSDFIFGIRSAAAAANAGLDIEMPFRYHYHRKLKRAVDQGEVSEAVLDSAVLRILRQKLRFAQVGEPDRYDPKVVAGETHRALAREAAVKSIVLLKNDPLDNGQSLLPLDAENIRHIAVIGKLAAVSNTGDRGSSNVRAPAVVTPLQGIKAALGPQVEVSFHSGKKLSQALQAAKSADVVLVVAGYTHADEGEYMRPGVGGDRDSLQLSPTDEALIQAVAGVNQHVVVALMGGSAIITENWRPQVPAILMLWYPGMEGGHALADILFGRENPSAKLPCVFPKSSDHLPFFDKQADTIEYGYYHGYRLMDQNGHEPAFAFGFGLSYTRFTYQDLHIVSADLSPEGMLQASISVFNVGQMHGEEIVQAYVSCADTKIDRPVKELKAFSKVKLAAGETIEVQFSIPVHRLAYYEEEQRQWIVEPGRYQLMVGSSSRSQDLLVADFYIHIV